MLRAAIIGAGNIAVKGHIPSYKSMEEVEIVGISDISVENAGKVAEEYGIPHYYQDAHEMLSSLKPDIVSICVPNKFHYPFAMAALEIGAHVFCEKPPALTVEEAYEMEKKAKEKGKILYYGLQNRFSPEFKKAYEILKSGRLGRVSHSEAKWLRRRGVPGWGVFTNKAIQGGGPLIDIGIHVLDMALSLLSFPEISYVSATMSDDIGKKGGEGDFGPWDGGKYSVEDSLFGMIVFKDGTSLSIDTSFAINQRESTDKNIRLFGDKAGISLYPLELYENREVEALETVEFDPRNELMKNFVKAIKGEEEPFVKAEEGTYLQALISSLYRAAETGKPVFF